MPTMTWAVTKAKGDNKIALAKCDGLAGDAQKACKDQADAALKAAKAQARSRPGPPDTEKLATEGAAE